MSLTYLLGALRTLPSATPRIVENSTPSDAARRWPATASMVQPNDGPSTAIARRALKPIITEGRGPFTALAS